ncbi:hypothetical protein AB4424_13800 [Vibrio splendidus]
MDGKLEYYDIKKFGFFERAGSKPSFSSQNEIMDNLVKWVDSRPNLENTKTWKAEKDKGEMNIYCCDADGVNGNYVFILWNEMSNAENEILSMPKSAKIGEGSVKSGFNSETEIPGLPSYYWVSIDGGFIATLHFDHAIVSITNFKEYVKQYIQNYSGYAVTDEEDDTKVIGYKKTNDESKSTSYFKFDLQRRIDVQTIERLRTKFQDIKKIVRKTKIEATNPADRNIIKRIMRGVGEAIVERGVPKSRPVEISVELEYSPSIKDLDKLIDTYKEEINEPSRCNNIGFILKNHSSKPIYLSGERLKTEHNFEILRKKRNPFGAKQMLDYIGIKKIRLSPPKLEVEQKKKSA